MYASATEPNVPRWITTPQAGGVVAVGVGVRVAVLVEVMVGTEVAVLVGVGVGVVPGANVAVAVGVRVTVRVAVRDGVGVGPGVMSGDPSQPASRAIIHQKALPFSLQLNGCECAQSSGRSAQSAGCAAHQSAHHEQLSSVLG